MPRAVREAAPRAPPSRPRRRRVVGAQVDATMAGNIARFMNHSCAPNAYSRIVEVGKGMHDKHIVVFAARDLQVGEELQYDYQFALGGEKIACHCGAPNCWGRMN